MARNIVASCPHGDPTCVVRQMAEVRIALLEERLMDILGEARALRDVMVEQMAEPGQPEARPS